MKKRILSLALTLVMVMTFLPVSKADAAGSATGQQIVDCAMQYLGKVPYVWGGEKIDGTNPGADCSGFICRIYEKFGFNFWANRTKLRNCGTNLGTDLSVAQKGDIIWFDGHVAIYAGISGGNHMIIHETGGKYQNVVYTKASIVSAELKGVIRIPGITNSGSGTVTPPVTTPNAKLTQPTDPDYTSKYKVTNTNAVLVTQVTKGSGVACTYMGMYLYDANGKLLKTHKEKISQTSIAPSRTKPYHSWYDVNTEVGYTLTPGTTYKYQFFGIFNGVEVKGGTYSFQTTGTAPAKTFTASIYLNSDYSAAATMEVTQGKAYGTLPTPYTKEGYTFDGYYTAKTGGTKVTSSTVFNGTSDIYLYPQYTKNPVVEPEKVTIYYYTDGNLTMTQTASIGDIYASDYMVKEGYTFLGWYSSATGGTKYNGTKITETSPRTLYAQYEKEAPQQYTVYLYMNGYVYKTLTVTNGSTYGTLPTPSLSGYTFQGWYTSVTGGSKVTSSTKVNLTGSQTLYARFAAVEVPSSGNIILQINNPTMYINGRPSSIDAQGTVPVIRNDRTLLPVRAVFEAMGGTVGWDGQNRIVTLTRDGETLYLQIGTGYAMDGALNKYYLDSAPVIINDRTMLPIRFIVEYFDGTVEWDGSTRTVLIKY
ncbi:MAG: InlB B-repeat-containing protein [Ruminiclostridium sp.]|nr:InlB B-repeat-containing protein [Ruminiclostridium sp.]